MLLENHNAIESGGYAISNSLRFQSASSQYLNRTPASAGNRKTFTYSVWLKRGRFDTATIQNIYYSNNSTASYDRFYFNNSTNAFWINGEGGVAYSLTTSQVFRDPSAWYHIVIAYDTTQATASNRIKLYVNGTQVTAFSSASYPALNADTQISNNVPQYIGDGGSGAAGQLFDGYLTEVNFIDGQALTPSSFGETDTLTGQWVAKKYTGTYGTNGFYLPFSNGTSTTTLGADSSGNGNNWTLNNFTRSAGVSDCWMIDVPSGNGGVNGTQPSSNYAVLNPLDKASAPSASNANLRHIGSSIGRIYSSMAIPSSGLFYAEFTNSTAFNSSIGFGFGLATAFAARNGAYNVSGNYGFYVSAAASIVNNGTVIGPLTYTNSPNQTFKIAIDATTGKVWLGQNNTWWNSTGGTTGNPSSGTNPTFTLNPTDLFIYTLIDYASSVWWDANFGQRAFQYSPPTGFKALCTANLTSDTVTVSGSFVGNVSADGPFVWCNGTPETLTINGNAVTFGTHADKLANGFKLRTTSSSYNSTGTNTWTATVLSPSSKSAFRNQNAKGNP